MNNLKEYIIEKLSLDSKKISDESLKKFMKALGIKKSDEYVLKLKHYCDTDCDKQLEKDDYIPKNMWNSFEFDALLMLAVMLLEDGYKAKDILNIGFKSYKGNNNPYDYSWFDEENDKNQTILELIQDAYHDSNKFKQFFDNFYDLAGHIWELTGITPDDICDFFDKMTS